MEKYLLFSLLYLSLQNVLLAVEYEYFFINMIEDIQNKTFDVTSSFSLILRNTLLYVIIYGSVLYLSITYVLDKASLFNAFVFGTLINVIANFVLIFYFTKGINHLPVFIFDSLVLGGLGLVIPIYLIRNYGSLMNSISLYIVAFYFLSSFFLYKYSNIRTLEKRV